MIKIWESERCYGRLPTWPDDVDALAAVMVDWPLEGRSPADSDWVKHVCDDAQQMQLPINKSSDFTEAHVVCLRDDTVIGMMLGKTQGTVNGPGSLAIHPNYRRQGYSKECTLCLMKWVFTAGYTGLRVSVFETEEQAEGARVIVRRHLPPLTPSGNVLSSQGQAVNYWHITLSQWNEWLAQPEQDAVRNAHFRALYPGHPLTTDSS